ncbi:MAG: DNA-binding protein [Clostridiales bacterium]|nr:DNA-binding protein [Clostridiales bacterium]
MQYKQSGNTWMIRIDLGEDIVQSLKKVCEDKHILLGRVEAIGAADHAVIGVYDLVKKEYYPEQIDEFMEIISLNGSITAMDGKPYIHLHAALADQDHGIHGGHVLEMRVGATCEMFVTVLDGEVTRRRDENLGINLWTF